MGKVNDKFMHWEPQKASDIQSKIHYVHEIFIRNSNCRVSMVPTIKYY